MSKRPQVLKGKASGVVDLVGRKVDQTPDDQNTTVGLRPLGNQWMERKKKRKC